jgi:hypothetical protein
VGVSLPQEETPEEETLEESEWIKNLKVFLMDK